MTATSVRIAFARVFLVASLLLTAVMVWFMFHNPTIHGVPLNGYGDNSYVGDWTCLAPYDITMFNASNEYGGNEVADSGYARTHCNAAAHRSFAVGTGAGGMAVACVITGVSMRRRPRDQEARVAQ